MPNYICFSAKSKQIGITKSKCLWISTNFSDNPIIYGLHKVNTRLFIPVNLLPVETAEILFVGSFHKLWVEIGRWLNMYDSLKNDTKNINQYVGLFYSSIERNILHALSMKTLYPTQYNKFKIEDKISIFFVVYMP